jgi:hypothetical protein
MASVFLDRNDFSRTDSGLNMWNSLIEQSVANGKLDIRDMEAVDLIEVNVVSVIKQGD